MLRNTLLAFCLSSAALLAAGPADTPPPPLVLENAELRISWRQTDAAITQVEWKPDGTRLLPPTTAGLGSAGAGRFAQPAQVRPYPGGQELSFTGAQGERIVYRLPASGQVLELVSSSVALELLPMPAGPEQAQGQGRVFSLEGGRIHAVPWIDLVKDPFFAFLGAQRKHLPPAAGTLGMDAGAARGATYFATIWATAPVPLRHPGGYRLPAQGSARLYLGPKQHAQLAAFGAEQVLDFGFFSPVGRALFWALHQIHGWTGNWGWALAGLALLLRLALWPLNSQTTRQGLRAQELEPFQKAIQAQHPQDLAGKAEQQKALQAFYRKNGHNPLGGCLPALVQMPVFLALYGMVGNVFELRHAPWLGWIQDLAGKDPYYVLPVLLSLGFAAQQALAPRLGDPGQRRMLLVLMPVMMLFMFASLPAGLNLYYLVFNLVGLAQSAWLTWTYEPRPVLA